MRLKIKFVKLQGSAVNQEEFEEISNQNKELQGQLNSASQTIGGLQNQLEDLKAEIEEKDKKLKELEEPHAVMAPAAARSPAGGMGMGGQRRGMAEDEDEPMAIPTREEEPSLSSGGGESDCMSQLRRCLEVKLKKKSIKPKSFDMCRKSFMARNTAVPIVCLNFKHTNLFFFNEF